MIDLHEAFLILIVSATTFRYYEGIVDNRLLNEVCLWVSLGIGHLGRSPSDVNLPQFVPLQSAASVQLDVKVVQVASRSIHVDTVSVIRIP